MKLSSVKSGALPGSELEQPFSNPKVRRQANRAIDHAVKWLLSIAASITILTTVAVVAILGSEAYRFFEQVPVFEFLFGTRWEPLLEPKSFGVLPLVMGTFLVVFGAACIALPAGLLIATYLSEFANGRVRAIIKPVLEVLAGIPTVVYGYFALTFVTPVLQIFLPNTNIFNALSAAIVVGIMILPMVSSLCDDAFRSVPMALREGGYAMGATPLEVIKDVIVPSCSYRIGAAVILAVSRAIGETMAVTLAAGATPSMTMNPLESIQTMTAYIVQVSMGDTPADGIEYLTCFAVGALLFVLTLTMNVIGSRLVLGRGQSA